MPVVLAHWGKASGAPGGRSLAYVLGNMLSAGGALLACTQCILWSLRCCKVFALRIIT